MKKCAECEKELITPLQEFGPANKPLCQSCFLASGFPRGMNIVVVKADERSELEKAEAELCDLEDNLREVEREIEKLEDEEWELKSDIRATKNKIEELKSKPPVPTKTDAPLVGLPLFEVARG